MTELVDIIQSCSPVLATAIIGMLFKLRSQGKDIDELHKRLDAYDSLKIAAALAAIQTDLNWIKMRLSKEDER